MNTLRDQLIALRERLKARTDSEREQAILRVVIAAFVIAGMGMSHFLEGGPGNPETALLLRGVAVFLVFSLGLLAWIGISSAKNVPRRAIAMIADAVMTTICIYLSGNAYLAIFGVYLFITFGYGFRFGPQYLFACQALCIVGYSLLLFDPTFQELHPGASGLMLALIVLPAYVATLLTTIRNGHARAEAAHRASERALKECLERERHAG